MEEPDVLLHEYDAELLGRLVDGRVVLAAPRRRDVLGARPVCAVDVVGEGELCWRSARTVPANLSSSTPGAGGGWGGTYESIAGKCDVDELAGPLCPLLLREGGGHLLEDRLERLALGAGLR